MKRAFLDANVLYSAAYMPRSGLLALWQLGDVELVTSDYALEEATRNLDGDERRARLGSLMAGVTVWTELPTTGVLFGEVSLPEKDLPILLAAVESGCEFLITGDRMHFGPYYGQTVQGVTVLTPRAFLDRWRGSERGK